MDTTSTSLKTPVPSAGGAVPIVTIGILVTRVGTASKLEMAGATAHLKLMDPAILAYQKGMKSIALPANLSMTTIAMSVLKIAHLALTNLVCAQGVTQDLIYLRTVAVSLAIVQSRRKMSVIMMNT